ncbi:MAG TPA: hypothetical protein VM095_13025 [Pyrinomonadaceae bacterium]|nr:hypothetical protein [Pyrinomonadaceae bacterium]
MKRKLLAIVLVLVPAALAVAAQSSPEWVKYTSDEGRYSALIPQQPKLSTQEATAPGGGKFTQYMAQTNDTDSLYMVGYFDYTEGMIFSLDKARDGMLDATKGTLIKEEPISLGGNAGRELKVATKNGDLDLLIRIRFYEIGRRIYVLQHIFQKASDTPQITAKTARFFDSFKPVPLK